MILMRNIDKGLIGNRKMQNKIKGIRTNCITGKTTEVTIAFDIRNHPTINANYPDWFLIIDGAVTGYESINICPDIIKRTSEYGWCACAGTKGSWDKLEILPEEMKKLWIFFGDKNGKLHRKEYTNV